MSEHAIQTTEVDYTIYNSQTDQDREDFNLLHARYLLNRDEEASAKQSDYIQHVSGIKCKVHKDPKKLIKSWKKRNERFLFYLRECGCEKCLSEIWYMENTAPSGKSIWKAERNPLKKALIKKVLKSVRKLLSFHIDGNWGTFECHEIGGNLMHEYYVRFTPNENAPKILLKTHFCEEDLLNIICLMDNTTTFRDWIMPVTLKVK